jgi:hypothetical protein
MVSLASPGGRLPRLSGQSTAKIAAPVISANTIHSIIKRVPMKGVNRHNALISPLYTTADGAGN